MPYSYKKVKQIQTEFVIIKFIINNHQILRYIMFRNLLFSAGLILVLCLTSTTSYSQFNPIKFERDSLPNGLQVIYQVDKTAPVVATVVHYRVGSRDEVKGKTGYAHFFEHLMFEATDNIPRASIDKYVQEAGGTLNAHTSWDETVYFFQMPSHHLNLALWIESQRMRKLRVDSIGVETQRGVVIEELKMRTINQPYGTFLNKLCENLFPGSQYAWPVIGYEEDLKKATIADFREFYDKHYQPSNAVLVISGDFEVKEAKKYVNEYFGIYPRVEVPKNPFTLSSLEVPFTETIDDPKAQLPAMFICYRGPKKTDDDYYTMNLLVNIIAAGESSRLYQRLVDKEQAAVVAQLSPLPLEYGGILFFVGVPSPGKDTKDIEKLFYDEVKKIVLEGVTSAELEKAKNITEASFVSGKRNVLEKANDLAAYFSYFSSPELINTVMKKYDKITIEDIKTAAKKWLDTDKKLVLTYMPGSSR